jgi:Cu(I)/Ag(I) efflux system membrane protein CusA/SilA
MKNIFKRILPENNYLKIPEDIRMGIIESSCKQVSRGVFFSTIIIIASFLPVFLLTGQEGKLFGPLAYTKTFIIAVDAIRYNACSCIDIFFHERKIYSGKS